MWPQIALIGDDDEGKRVKSGCCIPSGPCTTGQFEVGGNFFTFLHCVFLNVSSNCTYWRWWWRKRVKSGCCIPIGPCTTGQFEVGGNFVMEKLSRRCNYHIAPPPNFTTPSNSHPDDHHLIIILSSSSYHTIIFQYHPMQLFSPPTYLHHPSNIIAILW